MLTDNAIDDIINIETSVSNRCQGGGIPMQIEISGIKIEVQKKNIKNLRLAVLPPDGAVRISAPTYLSDDSIHAFVSSKIDWIKRQRERFGDQPKRAEREYASGESISVLGQQYFLRVEHSGKGNSLVLSGNEAILTVRKESTANQREAFVNEWYRALLKEQIAIYLPKWEEITGLHPDSCQIKNMTTRWGTCNVSARRIWLNLQLAKKPTECLEYVILHELTHLKVYNHGKDFAAIMDRYMPDWREIRKRLNDLVID